MTPRDRELVARLCAQRAGLSVDPDQSYIIESRLTPLARREGFTAVAELLQVVRDREDERLIWAVVEAMALRQAPFFRDPGVFEMIGGDLAPTLAAARGAAPLRIWNAACGSGQEIYSLAMTLDELEPPIPVELFASDLSERLLEKARSGLYSQFEVQRGLPARRLIRHFEKQDELFVLKSRIRRAVRWRRVNLVEDISGLGRFDIVMCRNVLPGLVREARPEVLRRLMEALAPHGFLILGSQDLISPPAGLLAVADRPGVFALAPKAASRAA